MTWKHVQVKDRELQWFLYSQHTFKLAYTGTLLHPITNCLCNNHPTILKISDLPWKHLQRFNPHHMKSQSLLTVLLKEQSTHLVIFGFQMPINYILIKISCMLWCYAHHMLHVTVYTKCSLLCDTRMYARVVVM